ncbi:MAG: hypothetical protein KBS75_06475 [Bacteroidales bacterium]|nr:hypothetical protein [Candidatus Equimonas faecalis]
MKYLYGAVVQGIQQFIFQTNELKDIVGASELVDSICTKTFEELLSNQLGKKLKDNKNAIINAAGNIKYELDTREECEQIVRNFPKIVLETAPGITISQAVVEYDETSGQEKFEDVVNKLENLLRAQRNKPMPNTTIGLMGIERSHTTNLPVVQLDKNEHLDAVTVQKRKAGKMLKLCEIAFGKKDLKWEDVATSPDQMTAKNDWIAVIHADGNGLGQIVQKVGNQRDKFKDFSQKLDKATKEAAVNAYCKLIKQGLLEQNKRIPIRPIVIGGDDFTVICRANIALQYVSYFIDEFETKTQEHLGSIIKENNVFEEGTIRDRLTACAGIAYVKSSYPFYYAYELAETLCSHAKKDAKSKPSVQQGKELAASCIMFHKVQDSFVENYGEIARRELNPNKEVTFEFGPYYLWPTDMKGHWTIEQLTKKAAFIDNAGKEGNAIKSHLRKWFTLLHDNPGMAKQHLARTKSLVSDSSLKTFIEDTTLAVERDRSEKKHIPAYDILTIHTINTQETRTEDEK